MSIKTFEFDGKLFVTDKIVAVGEVTTFNTGAFAYDWEYGFKVKLIGNNVKIYSHTRKNRMGEHLDTKKDRIETANFKRDQFILKIKEQNADYKRRITELD